MSEIVKNANGDTILIGEDSAVYTRSEVDALVASVGGKGEYAYHINDYTNANQRNGLADATTALQTAITAIETAMKANGGGCYVLDLGNAILRLDGALQDTSHRNAQILLPTLDLTGDEQCTLIIRGSGAPSSQYSVIGTIPKPVKGTRIKSTLTTGGGTSPAVFCGRAASGASWPFTMLNLVIEDVEFETVPNPLISCLNLDYVGSVTLKNVSVHTGTYTVESTAPTTSTSYGIICPRVSNNTNIILSSVFVLGFYNGFKISEHTEGTICATGCKVGLEVGPMYHGSRLDRFLSVHCAIGIKSSGGDSFLEIGQYAMERSTGGWHQSVYDVDDDGGYLHGSCRYVAVAANSGTVKTFTKRGGSSFSATESGSEFKGDVVDRFNKADSITVIGVSTSGHSPRTVGNISVWGISNRKAYPVTFLSGDYGVADWNYGKPNFTAEVTITTPASGGFSVGMVARVKDASNYLFLEVADSGTLKLYKKISGSFTSLGSYSGGFTNGQSIDMKIMCDGVYVDCYTGGVLRISYSAATGLEDYTYAGIAAYPGANDARFSNFKISE